MSTESQEERLQILEDNIQSLRDEIADARIQLSKAIDMLDVKNDSGPDHGRVLVPRFYDRQRK